MDTLPLDLIKFINYHLDWKDILNLIKVNKRYKSIHNNDFWKDKLYHNFINPKLVSKNNFCNLLFNQRNYMRNGDRNYKKELFNDNSKILAKYLKYKLPHNFKCYFLNLTFINNSSPSNNDNKILEKIEKLNVKRYNLIIVDLTYEWFNPFNNKTSHNYFRGFYFVLKNIDEMSSFKDYKEKGFDNIINCHSQFKNSMDEFGLNLKDAEWLYLDGLNYRFK